MGPIFLNNVGTRITADLAAAATSVSVSAGDGALFASATTTNWIPATLVILSGYKEIAWEEVRVTGRSSDSLTIVRAQEGSVALDCPAYYTLLSVRRTAGNTPALNDAGQTLTPTAVSSGGGTPVYVVQTGVMDAVNGRVRGDIDIQFSSLGTLAAGTVTINGLPYAASASYGRIACAVSANNLAAAITAPIVARILPGEQVIRLFKFASGVMTALSVSDLAATTNIQVTFDYPL